MGQIKTIVPNDNDVQRARLFLENSFPNGRIQKVLLVTPPDGVSSLFQIATARRRRYPNYPPYGLGIIAHHLESEGVNVKIINLNHLVLEAAYSVKDDKDFDFDLVWGQALDQVINDFQPDLIGITCMFTMTHPSLVTVSAYAAKSGIPIALGGVHVSNDAEHVLDDIQAPDLHFCGKAITPLETFVGLLQAKTI